MRIHPLILKKQKITVRCMQYPSAPQDSAPMYTSSAEELEHRSQSSADWKAGEGDRDTVPIGSSGCVRAENILVLFQL